jgi:hypothetical protein
MHPSPSEETFAQERRHSFSQQASWRMLGKTEGEWGASGAMISLACREAAKRTPFLLSELGPQNAATEEELRNARRKMPPNLMGKNGPQTTRISEEDKLDGTSSSISSV